MGGVATWFRKWFGGKQELLARSENDRVRAQPDLDVSHSRAERDTPVRPLNSSPRVSTQFAEDNNGFALAIYSQLRPQPGNVFFSPFSLRSALGMVRLGAVGDTAAEMDKALYFSQEGDELHAAFGEAIHRLNAATDGGGNMIVANSLWGQAGEPLTAAFTEQVVRQYEGSISLVDFVGAGEAAGRSINEWIEAKTNHKIRGAFPPGGVDPMTRLILVNAIYFMGKWARPFENALTDETTFYLEGGSSVRAPLMHGKETMGYVRTSGYQAIELAYSGDSLAMLVLLPNERNGLQALEESLSTQMLDECVNGMVECKVKLWLPRFKIRTDVSNLPARLRALGMARVFTRSQADLSGINGHAAPDSRALFLSAVHHIAFVAVDEAGTEAAAATVQTFAVLCLPPRQPQVPIFRADHPFLFAIRDRRDGTILFLGRLADPSRED